ncbi:hypothetical protein WPG_0314 [Winogradskyella sp. PG-2]|nr:hypothetical protein WPG_0314 [Winogradskyella sp. PG-2]
MVIMALDHVRDYFHINAFAGNYPENLESTNIILFGTRFIPITVLQFLCF